MSGNHASGRHGQSVIVTVLSSPYLTVTPHTPNDGDVPMDVAGPIVQHLRGSGHVERLAHELCHSPIDL